jgi:hypothetical protein
VVESAVVGSAKGIERRSRLGAGGVEVEPCVGELADVAVTTCIITAAPRREQLREAWCCSAFMEFRVRSQLATHNCVSTILMAVAQESASFPKPSILVAFEVVFALP